MTSCLWEALDDEKHPIQMYVHKGFCQLHLTFQYSLNRFLTWNKSCRKLYLTRVIAQDAAGLYGLETPNIHMTAQECNLTGHDPLEH